MGKIKSKMVRRTTSTIMKEVEGFSEDFGKNKLILGETMPSKKIRNQMAGLISRVKKQERIEKESMKID